MSKESYLKCIQFFRRPGWRSNVLFFMSKFVPVTIANIYFILCVLVFLSNPILLIRFIGIPFLAFVFVTILRKIINKKRPYEVYGFSPIRFDNKMKYGQSFPSRHCVSAAVISVICFSFFPWLGGILFVLTLIVAVSRVVSGLHFISDVICGIALGLIIGIIGNLLFVF